MFDFSINSTKSNYYDSSNKLVFGKMKHKIGGVAIEEVVGLESKIYLFFLDKSEREHKKEKGGNENKMQQYCCNNICNAVATISYTEYKDVLLNNKYI